jgi:hypothetical protein
MNKISFEKVVSILCFSMGLFFVWPLYPIPKLVSGEATFTAVVTVVGSIVLEVLWALFLLFITFPIKG